MKKRIFSVRTLLSGVLAILGFAGCEKAWNGECEYGSPSRIASIIGIAASSGIAKHMPS